MRMNLFTACRCFLVYFWMLELPSFTPSDWVNHNVEWSVVDPVSRLPQLSGMSHPVASKTSLPELHNGVWTISVSNIISGVNWWRLKRYEPPWDVGSSRPLKPFILTLFLGSPRICPRTRSTSARWRERDSCPTWSSMRRFCRTCWICPPGWLSPGSTATKLPSGYVSD